MIFYTHIVLQLFANANRNSEFQKLVNKYSKIQNSVCLIACGLTSWHEPDHGNFDGEDSSLPWIAGGSAAQVERAVLVQWHRHGKILDILHTVTRYFWCIIGDKWMAQDHHRDNCAVNASSRWTAQSFTAQPRCTVSWTHFHHSISSPPRTTPSTTKCASFGSKHACLSRFNPSNSLNIIVFLHFIQEMLIWKIVQNEIRGKLNYFIGFFSIVE